MSSGESLDSSSSVSLGFWKSGLGVRAEGLLMGLRDC